jgi:hypothetical protein
MDLIDTVKGLLSQDFTIKAYDCIANNDKALLYQMGFSESLTLNSWRNLVCLRLV